MNLCELVEEGSDIISVLQWKETSTEEVINKNYL